MHSPYFQELVNKMERNKIVKKFPQKLELFYNGRLGPLIWYQSLGFSLPLAPSGNAKPCTLGGGGNVTHTHYRLGKELVALMRCLCLPKKRIVFLCIIEIVSKCIIEESFQPITLTLD